MTDTIIVALITGSLSLIGVIITCVLSNRKMQKDFETKFEVARAVTDTKIEELTREVREHNNFARRMPVVEKEIEHIEGEIKKYHG